jgi:hypothetical protein
MGRRVQPFDRKGRASKPPLSVVIEILKTHYFTEKLVDAAPDGAALLGLPNIAAYFDTSGIDNAVTPKPVRAQIAPAWGRWTTADATALEAGTP